jgi:uncharacterized protein (TIGR00730 family)
LEPESRFRREKIRDTIVFFGSARLLPKETAFKNLEEVKMKKSSPKKIDEAVTALEMSKYYEAAVELSYRLTKWSLKLGPQNRFVICSGGGPGIMEAANKGARKANGKTVGLNISLPFEQNLNPYISENLNFEFHYFFMRKFWFAYLAKALVIMPGGFGTFDELFEILTLVQTKKIRKKMPIVIYGKSFWKNILDLDKLLSRKLIDIEDVKLFKLVDSVDEAFEFLKNDLTRNYLHIKTSLFNNKTIKQ